MTRAYVVLRSVLALVTGPAICAAQPTTRPSDSRTLRPAQEVLGDLLRPGPAARPLQPGDGPPSLDATTGAAAVAPGAAAMTVLREGTFVVDRTGRLSRTADGNGFEFTFDADAKAMRDPPLVILPNLKLMAMEGATKATGRDLRFRITGMVTEYNGRNYVLLEKVVVVPDGGT